MVQDVARRDGILEEFFKFVFIVLDRSHHYIQLLFVLPVRDCDDVACIPCPVYPLAAGRLFVIDYANKSSPIYCYYWSRRPKKSPLMLPIANNSV